MARVRVEEELDSLDLWDDDRSENKGAWRSAACRNSFTVKDRVVYPTRISNWGSSSTLISYNQVDLFRILMA